MHCTENFGGYGDFRHYYTLTLTAKYPAIFVYLELLRNAVQFLNQWFHDPFDGLRRSSGIQRQQLHQPKSTLY